MERQELSMSYSLSPTNLNLLEATAGIKRLLLNSNINEPWSSNIKVPDQGFIIIYFLGACAISLTHILHS